MSRKAAPTEPKQFLASGTVELRRVTFFITAMDADEARDKASRGDYDEYEIGDAETVNWKIDASTVGLNE